MLQSAAPKSPTTGPTAWYPYKPKIAITPRLMVTARKRTMPSTLAGGAAGS